MTRKNPLILFFLILPLTTGCTSMSAHDCLHANWYERGADAGRLGEPISDVLAQQNSCVHYGVVPDRTAFAKGWRAHQSS